MKRRVDELSGRGEAAVSGIVSAGGVGPGLTQGGGQGGSSCYVRGPITQLGARPGQPTTPVVAPPVVSGASVQGVVPVPTTTTGPGVPGGAPTPLDHQPHNAPSQPGECLIARARDVIVKPK